MFSLLLNFAKVADKAITAAHATVKKGGNLAAAQTAAAASAADYNPEHKGKKILTAPLRVKLTDALGHLAYNVAAAELGRPLE